MDPFSAGGLTSQGELKLELKGEGHLRKLPNRSRATAATLLEMVDQFVGILDQREMRKKLHPCDRQGMKAKL